MSPIIVCECQLGEQGAQTPTSWRNPKEVRRVVQLSMLSAARAKHIATVPCAGIVLMLFVAWTLDHLAAVASPRPGEAK
jgi:hypothetical protein